MWCGLVSCGRCVGCCGMVSWNTVRYSLALYTVWCGAPCYTVWCGVLLHVAECVAPHGVLLHIATRQPPPLPVSGSPPYSRVTKLSSESYLLPTCTMGLYQPPARDQRPKVGRGQQTVAASSAQMEKDNIRDFEHGVRDRK